MFYPRGNVLLLSLLLLAGGLVGGLTVATLVVSDLRQAFSLDRALEAQFDAESGLEQTLHDIRREDLCSTTTCDNIVAEPCKQATCTREINYASYVNIPQINVNDTFQLDLDPDDNATSGDWGVTWQRATTLEIPKLEVTYLVVLASGETKVERPNYVPYVCNPPQPDQTNCAALSLTFSPPPIKIYQVRFKALDYSVKNLVIAPTTGSFSNYLDVRAVAERAGTRQVLQTSVPRQLPVYGFPDYVIFSLQDIVK